MLKLGMMKGGSTTDTSITLVQLETAKEKRGSTTDTSITLVQLETAKEKRGSTRWGPLERKEACA